MACYGRAVKRTLTVLAIDGVGRETDDYLSLLRATQAYLGADVARLLTSDPRAAARDVDCVHIPPLGYLAYSKLCVEELTRWVDTDFALCVQLDGFVLNPERWSDDFFAFDYVGAPWRSTRSRPIDPARAVGNGGFSLRSKRFLDASSRLTWTNEWSHVPVPQKYWGNEDYFLCTLARDELETAGIRFATSDVAARFSVQAGDQLNRDHNLRTVLGFHGKKLLGKVRRYVEHRGLAYPHLRSVRRSVFPLFY